MSHSKNKEIVPPNKSLRPYAQRQMLRGAQLVGLSLCLSAAVGCGALKGLVSSDTAKSTASSSDANEGDNSSGSNTSSPKTASNSSASSKKASNSNSSPKKASKPSSKRKKSKPVAKLSPKRLRKKLREEMRKSIKALDAKLAEGAASISEADLTALQQQQAPLTEAGAETSAVYIEHLLKYYRIENGWRGERGQSGSTIAKLINAKVVAEGTLESGKETVLKAGGGACYFLLAHAEEGGWPRFEYHSKSGDSALSRFGITRRKRRGRPVAIKSRSEGFCTSKDIAVDVAAKLKDDQGSLRYIFMETPRESFSEYMASLIEVRVPDDCDAANWEQLWMKPIPGSIVFIGKKPFLTYRSDEFAGTWHGGLSAEARESRYDAKSTSSQAETLSFSKTPKFGSCPHSQKPHHSAATKKVAACYERLDKRYAPQFEAAYKARKHARSISARIAARGRTNQLSDSKKRAAKTCEQLEAQAHKGMAKAYEKIAEHYKQDKSLQFDRAKSLFTFYEGS